MFPSWHFNELIDAGQSFTVRSENLKVTVAPNAGRVSIKLDNIAQSGDADDILSALNALLAQAIDSSRRPKIWTDGPVFLDTGSGIEFSIETARSEKQAPLRSIKHYSALILGSDEMIHPMRHAVVEVTPQGEAPLLLSLVLKRDDELIEIKRFSKMAPPLNAHALVVCGVPWTGGPDPEELFDKLYGRAATEEVLATHARDHAVFQNMLARIRGPLHTPGAPMDVWTHHAHVRQLVADVRSLPLAVSDNDPA
jgi:hypothetical protein